MKNTLVFCGLFLAWLPTSLLAANYHVDSQTGDDARDGLSPATAWRTLERASSATFKPGDRVGFRSGGVWSGQLRITAQGGTRPPDCLLRLWRGRASAH